PDLGGRRPAFGRHRPAPRPRLPGRQGRVGRDRVAAAGPLPARPGAGGAARGHRRVPPHHRDAETSGLARIVHSRHAGCVVCIASVQGTRSNHRRRCHALAVTVMVAGIAAGGCGGGEEIEPVTPPVADPARAKSLATRYEPDLMLERHDGFWPVSVLTIDRLRSGDSGPCLALEKGAPCTSIDTGKLPWDSGPEKAYIDYPAANTDPGAQHDAMVQALGSSAPGSEAQLYFYVTGRSRQRPISLQYWFYYPYNYLQARLFGRSVLNTDLHEGDFEGMSILLSARRHRPVYVWMPRHTGEGERFVWNEGALQRRGDHPLGYVARGSHATYESCGRKFRTAPFHGQVADIPDDYFSCSPGDSYELGSTVPVVNMARTWWACWPGHFG